MDSGFRPVVALADLPPGRMKGVDVDGTPVLVANVDGTFHAIKDLCPHQFARLSEGALRGCAVTCPLHAWSFDLRTGEYLSNPRLRVRRYEVKVDGGDVLVRIPPEEGPA